jgi:hypothetical protein
MVRLATGAGVVVFAVATTGRDSFRAFAHLALCARAILRRDATEIIRVGADGDAVTDVIPVGWFAGRDAPEPFNDASSEIAWSSFSTCDCASLRSARSCWSAFARFPIVPPRF